MLKKVKYLCVNRMKNGALQPVSQLLGPMKALFRHATLAHFFFSSDTQHLGQNLLDTDTHNSARHSTFYLPGLQNVKSTLDTPIFKWTRDIAKNLTLTLDTLTPLHVPYYYVMYYPSNNKR